MIENIDFTSIFNLETYRSRRLRIFFDFFREHPHMGNLISPSGLMIKLRWSSLLNKYAFLIFPLLYPLIHNLFHRFVYQFLHFSWVKRKNILGILKKMTFCLRCSLARLLPHPSMFRSAACQFRHYSLHINHI